MDFQPAPIREQLSMLNAVLLAFAILAVYLGGTLLRSYTYFDPLSRFPGPRLASVSTSWSLWTAFRGKRTGMIHKMHQELGPIVRIGPNELSLNAPEAIRALYSTTPFQKDPRFYGALKDGKSEGSVVTLTDPIKHRKRRGLLSGLFTRSSVQVSEREILYPKVIKALLVLRKSCPSEFDVAPLIRALSTDSASELTFGVPFGCLDTPRLAHPILAALDIISDAIPVLLAFPWLEKMPRVCLRLSAATLPLVELDQFVNEAWKVADGNLSDKSGRVTVLTKLRDALRDLSKEQRDSTATTEAKTMIVAGSDTVTISTGTTLHELSKRPDLQERIREEVMPYIPDSLELETGAEAFMPSFTVLEKLPILSSVIKEALRLYPPVPCSLPRVVPKGGFTVADQFIPENTVVGLPAWTLHRDPVVFPNPEVFDPYRWLNASEEELKVMEERFLPFSRGSVACIGQTFAHAQLHITIALCCRFFKFLLPSTVPSQLDITDFGGTLRTRDNKVVLRVEAH